MKFTCEKTDLVNAISVASRTVAVRSAIASLEGILLKAGMSVMLTGYNLETGITVSMDADISETGSCIMPAKLFFEIVRKLPDEAVSISVDENFKVSIKAGISSFTITAGSAEDYPELPEVESNKGIYIPQNKMREMISGTIFSASENFARPVHTGCLFEIENECVTVVAVDGYRLALRRYFPEESLERTVKFVIPAAALKECEKILEDEGNAVLYLGPKHILITMGAATLVCRILEGDFLDWRRVLPQDNPIKLTSNVSQLQNSIERVGIVISEKIKSPVRCKFGLNEAQFQTVSTIGEAHDSCSMAGDGKDLEIGFNCRYLLDALRAVETDEVCLELVNGLSPIVLTPCDGSGSFAYMVLPVRLKAGE